MFKFQCGLWHSAHIDDVRPPPDKMPSFIEMYHNPVSTFLQEEKKMDVDEENETLQIDILSLINNCVQPALSKVKDPEEDSQRTTERIRIILNLIQDSREKGNNHKARVNFIIYKLIFRDVLSSLASSCCVVELTYRNHYLRLASWASQFPLTTTLLNHTIESNQSYA